MQLESDERPWGGYQCLLEDDDCKVKKLWLKPGERNSYQRHQKRSEIWVVISGQILFTIDDEEILAGPGQIVEARQGAKHRFMGAGDELSFFIEVQTGTYFGEDDIERIEDDYGREGTKEECVDGKLVK